MSRMTISKMKDCFEKDGRKFFCLADTVWAAFANATEEEWTEYLDYRRFQGFDALQVSILPILKDASQSDIGILPFESNSNGRFDYNRINPDYFDRAEKLLSMAVDKGFIPYLVLLWLDYVPDTWGSKREPELVMPDDKIRSYVQYAARRFARFHPVYLVSGDTDFESERAVRSYMTALETLKEVDPDALATLHLCGNHGLPPEAFVNSEKLDFYMYQSFHRIETQSWVYELAEQFTKSPVKRPFVNGEPCYEGHGHALRCGRFGAFDCRKAFWQSVLSGAKAGVAYGAHGIWSWHKKGKEFCSVPFSGVPYDWRTALRLKGAWDAVFAKWMMESFRLFTIEPGTS